MIVFSLLSLIRLSHILKTTYPRISWAKLPQILIKLKFFDTKKRNKRPFSTLEKNFSLPMMLLMFYCQRWYAKTVNDPVPQISKQQRKLMWTVRCLGKYMQRWRKWVDVSLHQNIFGGRFDLALENFKSPAETKKSASWCSSSSKRRWGKLFLMLHWNVKDNFNSSNLVDIYNLRNAVAHLSCVARVPTKEKISS